MTSNHLDTNLSRRRFLKGLGIGSLAFSPLVTASRALANTGVKPRLAIFMIAHGIGGPGLATGTETKFTLAPRLDPLKDIQQHVTLVDTLLGVWWGNFHSASLPMSLTASCDPNSTQAAPRPAGPSIDALLHHHLGGGIMPPLRLGKTGSGNSNYCWDMKRRPLPMLDPSQSNNLLRNVIKSPTGTSSLTPRSIRQKHLLDGAVKDLKALNSRISPSERIKLESQLDALSQTRSMYGLSKQVESKGACQRPAVFNNTAAKNSYASWLYNTQSKFDDIKLAFQCNLTNYAVVTFGEPHNQHIKWKDTSGKSQVGRPCNTLSFHHCVAHFSSDRDRRLCYEGSVREYMRHIVNFAKELDKVKEANGKTMLENTIIVVSGDLGNGNHNCIEKPYVLIGGRGAPGLRTGRYIDIPTGNRLVVPGGRTHQKNTCSTRTEADLWREICNAMGHKTKQFGVHKELNMGNIGIA